jgi:hypothetical protein
MERHLADPHIVESLVNRFKDLTDFIENASMFYTLVKRFLVFNSQFERRVIEAGSILAESS